MRCSVFAALLLSAAFARAWRPDWNAIAEDPETEVIPSSAPNNTAWTEIKLPCSGCLIGQGADEALVFDFALHPLLPNFTPSFSLNSWRDSYVPNVEGVRRRYDRRRLTVLNRNPYAEGLQTGSDDDHHTADVLLSVRTYNWSSPAAVTEQRQHFHFHIARVDGRYVTRNIGFIVVATPGPEPSVLDVVFESTAEGQALLAGSAWPIMDDPPPYDFHDSKEAYDITNPDKPEFTVDLAIEELRFLEQQLSIQRHRIYQYLHEDRRNVELSQMLEACDGLLCQVKVAFLRMCDMATETASWQKKNKNEKDRYRMQQFKGHDKDQMTITAATFKEPPHSTRNRTRTQGAQAMGMPLIMTKAGSPASLHSIDMPKASNPVVIFLECLAGLLGLSALYKLIRTRCMSLRSRVERAADREEKRNARAYRRAARRAYVRKNWDTVVGAVSCFRRREAPRIEDYEEKRALILQDAYLETLADLDQAEKGEVMDAEIRELRHANEIVASLVRTVDPSRFDLATPIHDPPPSMVPLPQMSGVRSRASTQTLPSYATSEGLPEYVSRVNSSEGSSIVGSVEEEETPRYTPSTTMTDEPLSYNSSQVGTNTTGRTRYTPGSSIIEVSPRPSAETLRTRMSKEYEGPVNPNTRDV